MAKGENQDAESVLIRVRCRMRAEAWIGRLPTRAMQGISSGTALGAWWNGIHEGLKIPWLRPCRFESCRAHHFFRVSASPERKIQPIELTLAENTDLLLPLTGSAAAK